MMGGPVPGGTMTNGIATGGGSAVRGGPELGTGDPSVDREDRKAPRMVSSVCEGC
jgi:hypothetical protein